MTRNKKILIGVGVAAVLGGIAYANFKFKRTEGVVVNTEAIKKHDLEAIVSASGKIQPKRFVNISADTMGRVTDLAVNEGDRVKKDQFLLQVDPRNLRSAVTRTQASLDAARSQTQQLTLSIESAKTSLKQAEDNLNRQQQLWKGGLTTRESLDRAENELKMRQSDLRSQEQQIQTQRLRMQQEEASLETDRYNLSKVRIESPINGIVTRRNIEEGEMVVVGTMNNAGTVLLTIADMSVIEAEVEVDETDIPSVSLGQVAKITIDAIPEKTFTGKVTEIGNSPIQATGQAARQATNFKVVITLDSEIPDVRPGFTCTSEITTATRKGVVGVPIQATTVREVVVDDKGAIVREPETDGTRRRSTSAGSVQASELKPGQSRKELEGVFVVRDGKAHFTPVTTGIAGEKFFEVLTGLKEGESVIVGPFSSVRELSDGAAVKVEQPVRRPGTRYDDMNQFLEAAGIALNAIWSNKLRSFLTVLGNIVAVTSIIAVVSLIQGMNGYVTKAILSDVGADTFQVQRFPITRTDEEFDKVRNNPRLTIDDAVAIRGYSENVAAVAMQASNAAEISYGAETLESVNIRGVSREYILFSTYEAERGRLISPIEVDRNRNVVLLGSQTAERLFKEQDPIDKVILIGGVHHRVIGVNEEKGSMFGQSQDEFAVVPLGSFNKLFGSRGGLEITVRPKSPELVRAAMDDATIALRIERRLKPKEGDNFGMFTSDTLLDIYRQATAGIFAVLVGVVALSLVVGGIVIMNIMLMVVSERTREIGLRKALGARRRDIIWQILTESVTLSTMGGFVGTALGFVVAMIIAALTPLPAAVEVWSVAIGIGITAVVGLFFGLYPALRASRLDPIEALRRE